MRLITILRGIFLQHEYNIMKNSEKSFKKMTVEKLPFYMVHYGLLSPEEAEIALRTSELPDSIMDRMRILERLLLADKSSKN